MRDRSGSARLQGDARATFAYRAFLLGARFWERGHPVRMSAQRERFVRAALIDELRSSYIR